MAATTAEIEQALKKAESLVRLVDTRPAEQYAGQAIWTPEGSRPFPPWQNWLQLADGRVMRGGHIPGALHLHATSMLNPSDWTFRDPAAIHALARARGLDPAQRIITYCGVGISASLGLFALHLAGGPL